MTYRHELKFLVPEQDLCLLENKISQICPKDIYAGEKGIYNIRSIYFDTFDDRYLEENAAGVDNRRKYRSRIYNQQSDVIKLECKSTMSGLRAKEACRITGEQCEQLMAGNIMIPCGEGQNVLRQMQYDYMTSLLQPKVIVEYVRTPFVYEAGNVRVTFDRQIAASDCIQQFFHPYMAKRQVLPDGMNILEVKYDEVLPVAVKELLNTGFSLSRTSFSKYAMCRINNLR